MGTKTRIGIMSLSSKSMGSVELPEEITLYCPQCGTEAADKGQCLLELAEMPGESKSGMVVNLIVDCRSCGCYGKPPAASSG